MSLVVVASFSNKAEAEVAKGFLENENIAAMVDGGVSNGVQPHLDFHQSYQLKVSPEDESTALEIINKIKQASEDQKS